MPAWPPSDKGYACIRGPEGYARAARQERTLPRHGMRQERTLPRHGMRQERTLPRHGMRQERTLPRHGMRQMSVSAGVASPVLPLGRGWGVDRAADRR
jgi:hypothetical protein